MPEPGNRRLRRTLWGIALSEAQRRLREQEEQSALELRQLREAIDQVKAEEADLQAQCAALEEQVRDARTRLEQLRTGLDRHQAMAPIQELVLAREIADLEEEHARRMAALQAEQERIRAEIAGRRASLHRWVQSLLASVAERGTR
jgi:predicted nuclease with TOPRIM domain